MKMLLYIFLLIAADDGINRIAEINKYKEAGNKAYLTSDYEKAAQSYRYLYDTLKVKEDPVLLNLGHSYYQLHDTTNARSFYGILTASKDKHYRSVAHQQLGIIASDLKKYPQALAHFKNALKADPQNQEARYNYELTKRMLENQEQQQKNENGKKDIEPSDFAKRLKEQADELIRNDRFSQAFALMQQGLKQDETVQAYDEFIKKLQDVVEVESVR